MLIKRIGYRTSLRRDTFCLNLTSTIANLMSWNKGEEMTMFYEANNSKAWLMPSRTAKYYQYANGTALVTTTEYKMKLGSTGSKAEINIPKEISDNNEWFEYGSEFVITAVNEYALELTALKTKKLSETKEEEQVTIPC